MVRRFTCVFLCFVAFCFCLTSCKNEDNHNLSFDFTPVCEIKLNERYDFYFDIDEQESTFVSGIFDAIAYPLNTIELPVKVKYDVDNEEVLDCNFYDVCAGSKYSSYFSNEMKNIKLDGQVFVNLQTDHKQSFDGDADAYVEATNVKIDVYLLISKNGLESLSETGIKDKIDYVLNNASYDMPIDFDAFVFLTDNDNLSEEFKDLCVKIYKDKSSCEWFYEKHCERK